MDASRPPCTPPPETAPESRISQCGSIVPCRVSGELVMARLTVARGAVLAPLERQVVVALPAEDVKRRLARVRQVCAAAAMAVDAARRARAIPEIVVAGHTIDAHVQLVWEVHGQRPHRPRERLHEPGGRGPHGQHEEQGGYGARDAECGPVPRAQVLVARPQDQPERWQCEQHAKADRLRYRVDGLTAADQVSAEQAEK